MVRLRLWWVEVPGLRSKERGFARLWDLGFRGSETEELDVSKSEAWPLLRRPDLFGSESVDPRFCPVLN